ncbi:helix-turn-helix transcriptional regulator [Filimonas effusa]|uniref:XRE family transcriptional regulator n=1 Tax=Filimonas effusa TaxID=2508721 RepID=A0A4Q1D1V2_9BACT|nr:helix-turn-helix transcriptional regulator [Filimonas effusa]RXK81270.1 XRE family transcriptional regulator [Filimonas effusa]
MARRKVERTEIAINRIKGALADSGKTIGELERHFGVARSTVSHWVNNKVQPDVYTFYAIAEWLDIDIKDLFHSTKDKKK